MKRRFIHRPGSGRPENGARDSKSSSSDDAISRRLLWNSGIDETTAFHYTKNRSGGRTMFGLLFGGMFLLVAGIIVYQMACGVAESGTATTVLQ